jgi:hypothetical protein
MCRILYLENFIRFNRDFAVCPTILILILFVSGGSEPFCKKVRIVSYAQKLLFKALRAYFF